MTVNVILPPAPVLSAEKSGWALLPAPELNRPGPGAISNGMFALTFTGRTNIAYSVWASTNLHTWELLGPATDAGGGSFSFVDADTPLWPRRFYRVGLPVIRGYAVRFSGASNATYRVWASTNLVAWEPLGTAIVTGDGWYQFLDLDATNWPQRFYRAVAP